MFTFVPFDSVQFLHKVPPAQHASFTTCKESVSLSCTQYKQLVSVSGRSRIHLYITICPLTILKAKNACLLCHRLIWILSFSVDIYSIRIERRSWVRLQAQECMLYSRSSNMRHSTPQDAVRLRILAQKVTTHHATGQYGLID
jgi:hypothetical protein